MYNIHSQELLFKGHNCRIVHRNKAFMVVMPLDWECAVFMNSFECGGEGAKWDIGNIKNFLYWNIVIENESLFYLIYFFKKLPFLGKKLLLEYVSEGDLFMAYTQENIELFNLHPIIEKICRKDMESLNKIALPRIMEYEEFSHESLFAILERSNRIKGSNMDLEICSLIIKNGNEKSRNRLRDFFNTIYLNYRNKCLESTYTNFCIKNIEENESNRLFGSDNILENSKQDLSLEEFNEKIINEVIYYFPQINNKEKLYEFFMLFIKEVNTYEENHSINNYDKASEEIIDNIILQYVGMLIVKFCKGIDIKKTLSNIESIFKYIWCETKYYKWVKEAMNRSEWNEIEKYAEEHFIGLENV